MSLEAPTTVEGDPDEWLIHLVARENLFKGIKLNNVPYITLQNHARLGYGSRSRPVTPLEMAEHDLHEKLKAKVPIFRLQMQLALVEQLEEEQINGKLHQMHDKLITKSRNWNSNYPIDEEAQRSRGTTREDLLSASEDNASSSKRRKPASRVVVEDDGMPPQPAKRCHILIADDAPSRPQQSSQAQLKAAVEAQSDAVLARKLQAALDADPEQEANNGEIARILAEDSSELPDMSSAAVVGRLTQAEGLGVQINLTDHGPYPQGLHCRHIKGYAQSLAAICLKNKANPPRPKGHHSDPDSDARDATIDNRKKAQSRKSANRTPLPDDEDEIDYESNDCDTGLPSRRSRADLARQKKFDDVNHGLTHKSREGCVAESVRQRATKVVKAARRSVTHNQRAPFQSLILDRGRAGRDDNQSDGDDSDGDLPAESAARAVENAPVSNIQRASYALGDLRGGKASRASDDNMPPAQLSDPYSCPIEPQESVETEFCCIEVELRARQSTETPDPPERQPARAPRGPDRGRASQDREEPINDELYRHDPKRQKYAGRTAKRHRTMGTVLQVPVLDENRNHVRDIHGRNKYRNEEWESDVSVGSDSPPPAWCKSPPPSWAKIKLSGRNGLIWDSKWDPQKDPEPKGARNFAVPAGEALVRPKLPILEFLGRNGMESRRGSEFLGGATGSLAGSRSQTGGGISGTVRSSMAPPSTYAPQSMRYSVRYKELRDRRDDKHERSITRTTPVSSIAGTKDDAPVRSMAQRLGLGLQISTSIENRPLTAPSTSSAPRISGLGEVHRRQLTLTNVAILEAQTGQPTHPAAVVRGKLRDIASGDDDRMLWLGDETHRGSASIAPSDNIRATHQAINHNPVAISATPRDRNSGASRLRPVAPNFIVPRHSRVIDLDIPEDDCFISPAPQNINQDRALASPAYSAGNGNAPRLPPHARHLTVPTGVGHGQGTCAYGGSLTGSRETLNFRGPRGGRGGFGERCGGSQAGGIRCGGRQRGGRRAGGRSLYSERHRGGRGGCGGRPQRPPADHEEEYERMRKEAEEKYPFEEA